jgi:cell shape-determining protein MreC
VFAFFAYLVDPVDFFVQELQQQSAEMDALRLTHQRECAALQQQLNVCRAQLEEVTKERDRLKELLKVARLFARVGGPL